MESAAHEKFLRQLRSPVDRCNSISCKKRSQNSASLILSPSEDRNSLMRELQVKFEELFAPTDDD